MSKFRSRLLIALATLLLTVLVSLGFVIGNLISNVYLDSFHNRAVRDIDYFRHSIAIENLNSVPFLTKLQKEMNLYMNMDAVIFNEQQDVLLETNGKLKERMKNYGEDYFKTNIQKLKSSKGNVVTKKLSKQKYLYQTKVEDAFGNEAYLFVSFEVIGIEDALKKVWLILSSGLFIAFVVILLLGLRITTKYTRPIEGITEVAMQLAKGNYRARSYEEYNDETGMLNQAINTLARNLQESMVMQEMQQDRLETLIENLGSGVLLIDKRGFINLVNKTYRQTFQVHKQDILYHLYYEVIPNREVVDLIGEIFLTEVNVKKQLVIPFEIERRYFDIYGAPIIGGNHEWKGIVVVFHDITELKRLEQVRKDFLANVSHELRTPITSIKGFTETLLDGAGDDEELRNQFLKIIHKESDRMQMLILDLLELSKMEQSTFKLDVNFVNMSELVQDAIMVLQKKADQKEILILMDLEDEVYIKGDENRLKQVIMNLIVNAIHYTNIHGQISIRLHLQNDEVHVKVEDTGIGISPEEVPRIFERFYRVDRARSRDSGGTGLGLAIVKHIIEAHKGKIRVESEVGKGTTFYLTFQVNW